LPGEQRPKLQNQSPSQSASLPHGVRSGMHILLRQMAAPPQSVSNWQIGASE